MPTGLEYSRKRELQGRQVPGLEERGRQAVVIPVVVGALGMVTNQLEGFIRKIGVDVSVGLLQKACFQGTARIFRRVLEA